MLCTGKSAPARAEGMQEAQSSTSYGPWTCGACMVAEEVWSRPKFLPP